MGKKKKRRKRRRRRRRGGTTNQNGRQYKTNSLFLSLSFFYVIHQSGVGRASGREGGGKWNVSIFIFYSSFSLVDNIKSHRQAKKGLRKEKTFVSDRGG